MKKKTTIIVIICALLLALCPYVQARRTEESRKDWISSAARCYQRDLLLATMIV